MRSKVKDIKGSGTYDSKFGLLYKFEYTFEDGVSLIANHKTETSPFSVGDEVEYEVKNKFDWGNVGKVGKPDDNFSSQNSSNTQGLSLRDKSIVYQVAFKESCNYFHSVLGITSATAETAQAINAYALDLCSDMIENINKL